MCKRVGRVGGSGGGAITFMFHCARKVLFPLHSPIALMLRCKVFLALADRVCGILLDIIWWKASCLGKTPNLRYETFWESQPKIATRWTGELVCSKVKALCKKTRWNKKMNTPPHEGHSVLSRNLAMKSAKHTVNTTLHRQSLNENFLRSRTLGRSLVLSCFCLLYILPTSLPHHFPFSLLPFWPPYLCCFVPHFLTWTLLAAVLRWEHPCFTCNYPFLGQQSL